MRVLEPPGRALNAASRRASAGRQTSGPPTSAQAVASSQTSAPSHGRSGAATTRSRTKGRSASISWVRRVVARTQVPDASLNSSARRPAKTMPASGRAASTQRAASPVLKKPSSSKACALASGLR